MKIVALVTARAVVCIALFLVIAAVVGFLATMTVPRPMAQLWQELYQIVPRPLADLLPGLYRSHGPGMARFSFSRPVSGWLRVICMAVLMAVLGTCVLGIPAVLAAITKAIWGRGRGVFAMAAFLAGLYLGAYQPGLADLGSSIPVRPGTVCIGALLGICLAAGACVLSEGWGALWSAGTGRLCMLIAGTVANILLFALIVRAAGATAYGLSICFGANTPGPDAWILRGLVQGGNGIATILILAMAPAVLLNSFFRAGRLAFAVFASLLALYPGWQYGIDQSLSAFAVIGWGAAYMVLCGITAWLLAGAWAACLSTGLPDEQPPQGDAIEQAAPPPGSLSRQTVA